MDKVKEYLKPYVKVAKLLKEDDRMFWITDEGVHVYNLFNVIDKSYEYEVNYYPHYDEVYIYIDGVKVYSQHGHKEFKKLEKEFLRRDK